MVTAVKIGLNALLIFGAGRLPAPRAHRRRRRDAAISQGIGLVLFLTRGLARVAATRRSRCAAPTSRGARPHVREVVRLALPGVGERLANNLALLAYFRVLSGYGSIVIAAYTVGVRLLAFTWIPGIGFGTAASTLVGQALGAARPARPPRAPAGAPPVSRSAWPRVLGGACLIAPARIAGLFTQDAALVERARPVPDLPGARAARRSRPTSRSAARCAAPATPGRPSSPRRSATGLLRVPLAFLFAFVLARTGVVDLGRDRRGPHGARAVARRLLPARRLADGPARGSPG